jgi:hypothetical protein
MGGPSSAERLAASGNQSRACGCGRHAVSPSVPGSRCRWVRARPLRPKSPLVHTKPTTHKPALAAFLALEILAAAYGVNGLHVSGLGIARDGIGAATTQRRLKSWYTLIKTKARLHLQTADYEGG